MREWLGTTVAEFRTTRVSVTKMDGSTDGLMGIEHPQIVLTDLPPDVSAIALLARLKRHLPHAQVILLTNRGNVSEAVDAMRAGALHVLEQPVDRDSLLLALENAWRDQLLCGDESELARPTAPSVATTAIVGRAPSLHTLLDTVQARCAERCELSDRRRERHRQGVGRRCDPCVEWQGAWTIRQNQLRRDS